MLTEALNEAVALDCADIEGEAAGFLHHVGSKVRSVGYVEGQSPTIIAEKPPATVCRRDAEPLAFNAGNPVGQPEQAGVPAEHGLPDAESGRGDAHGAVGARAYALQGNMIGRKPENGPNGKGTSEELCFTLDTISRHGVAYRLRGTEKIGSQYVDEGKVVCMDGCETEGRKYVVRRLTPVECERLQGFPDDFTKVPYKGKAADECPDGPRYKALGNSMAVPVIEWIGRRIEAVCGDGD